MSIPRSWLVKGLIIFGIWTSYGLLAVYQSYLISHYVLPESRPWGLIVRANLSSMWIWAALTPIVLWLAGCFRVTKETWAVSIPAHLFFLLVVSVVDVSIDILLSPIVGLPPRDRPFYKTWLLQFDGNFFSYIVVASIAHAAAYYQQFRDRERRAAQLELEATRLESQLGRARLDALKMQLQPHFLFNTLHAISELVHEDPAAADRMVTGLGDMLRMSLDDAGRQEVSLLEEMSFVNAYLEIEKCRYADRLTVETEIEPVAFDARVPHLILQPLVENAVRHGAGASDAGCRIRIAARRVNGMLDIVVEDDGPGFSGNPPELKEGVGLRNARDRLRVLYGDAQTFDLSNRPGGGASIHLAFPFR